MKLVCNLADGQTLEFYPKTKSFVIGRSPSADISIVHDGLSRKHCQIAVENDSVVITDLNSTNGVFINGERISPNTPTPYQTFLSLAVGPIQSLQIIIEDKDKTQTGFTPPPPKPQNNSDKVSTSNTLGKQSKGKKPSTKSSSGKSFLIKAILLILLIAAALHFYFQDSLMDQDDLPPPPSGKSFDF